MPRHSPSSVLAETQVVVVKHLAFLFMQTLQFQTKDQVDLQVIRLLHVEIGAMADGFNVRKALEEQFRRLDPDGRLHLVAQYKLAIPENALQEALADAGAPPSQPSWLAAPPRPSEPLASSSMTSVLRPTRGLQRPRGSPGTPRKTTSP